MVRYGVFIGKLVGHGGNIMRYPVVIHKDKDSDFGVTVPDIPGCFSAGETMDEALLMAQEAIECHLEGLLIDGDVVPVPTAIENHQKNKEFKSGVWAVGEIDISKLSVKSKRINITMPERLINTVDNYAQRHGSSRSGILAQAITEYMSAHP